MGNLKNRAKLAISNCGTAFETRTLVLRKFTHKDLLLIAGIVVALLVALSTVVWESQESIEHSGMVQPRVKTLSASVIQKIGQSLIRKF